MGQLCFPLSMRSKLSSAPREWRLNERHRCVDASSTLLVILMDYYASAISNQTSAQWTSLTTFSRTRQSYRPSQIPICFILARAPIGNRQNHFDIIQWISGRKEAEPTEGDTQHQNQSKLVPQFDYDNRCALLIIIIPTHAHWPPLCINQIHFATAKRVVIISTGEWRGSQHTRMSRRKQTKPRHLDAEEEEDGLTILGNGRLSFYLSIASVQSTFCLCWSCFEAL